MYLCNMALKHMESFSFLEWHKVNGSWDMYCRLSIGVIYGILRCACSSGTVLWHRPVACRNALSVGYRITVTLWLFEGAVQMQNLYVAASMLCPWKITSCRVNTTACSMFSGLPFICGDAPHPPFRGDGKSTAYDAAIFCGPSSLSSLRPKHFPHCPVLKESLCSRATALHKRVNL